MRPHRGILVLTLGLISLFIVILPIGAFAWGMANNDFGAMDSGQMDPTGRQITAAGKICGMIGTALFIITMLILICVLLWTAGRFA